MKSTLYLKFIIIYMIFGFMSLFTVATLTRTLTEEPLERNLASDVYQEANLVANEYLPHYFLGQMDESAVHTQLVGMEAHLDGAVWFVDREGNMITSAHSDGYPTAPTAIEDFNPAEIGSAKYEVGTYHDYFKEDVITVIAPVVHGYSTQGYLLIHKSMTQIGQLQITLMNAAYITLAVIYLLSFSILLGIQFIVYRPLCKITEAAKQYASGNLDYEIPVNTEDEIGYLSASLNFMSSQLRDMEDYQKKFVANVSHDFRSPLTSIKGYAEAIADGTIPPEMQQKYFNIILFEVERLTKLTGNLLELNQFEQDGLVLELADFDINHAIKDSSAAFEQRCTEKKISLNLIFSDKELFVNADINKIQQVIQNLLDNAIKFSPNDTTIEIRTAKRNHKVFISVKDHGIGIAKESQKKIWTRFYKTDDSRGKDKTGTGLGLSITKEIIEAHNENINVISTEGVGTEFIFTLPPAKKDEKNT